MSATQSKRATNRAVEIILNAEERTELMSFAGSRSLPHSFVQRAKIVLAASEGVTNMEIAKQVGLSRQSVGKWRNRYAREGLSGIYDQMRSGRPRTLSDDKIMEVVSTTLRRKPENATHWSTRSMAEISGVSRSTVHRVWKAFGLKPHRQKHFKLSTDPFFVEKVRDIVGLYLNPPENAMVLCVDEKSQCQALERTQPLLPMGLGYVEGVTHNYIRHGTLTLFAALDVATGQVIERCTKAHRHQEFLQFLKQIDSNTPPELDLHMVLDNYATHKHHKVRRWLANHPRFHLHFTPTYSSWLNQVERWFGIITQQAIRRGSFTSTKHLRARIEAFTRHYNQHKAASFNWTATADSILNKIQRLCEGINET